MTNKESAQKKRLGIDLAECSPEKIRRKAISTEYSLEEHTQFTKKFEIMKEFQLNDLTEAKKKRAYKISRNSLNCCHWSKDEIISRVSTFDQEFEKLRDQYTKV
jgi:hypothetical protein